MAVESDEKYHLHSAQESEFGSSLDFRGRRPFYESSQYSMDYEMARFMELMTILDHCWQTEVPHFGHDVTGDIRYSYTMMVDYEEQLVAFKSADVDALCQFTSISFFI